MPRTLAEKVWERHVVHRAEGEPDLLYVDLHLVHEVTSPQAFEGLRLAGRPVRRPDLTVGTMDHNVPTTDGPVTDRDQRPADGGAADQRRRVRHHAVSVGLRRAGDRARDRSRDGLHAARHDDRVRRLAHLDPRRVRGARVRHRHERGRARAGHADPAAVQAAVDGGDRRRRSPTELQREGHHPGDHQSHRHQRRGRPRDRVPRRCDPGALDGGPHDDLQHVDRGRCARRHGRAGRDHLRLRAGSTARADRRRLGAPRSRNGARCRPTTAPCSTPR